MFDYVFVETNKFFDFIINLDLLIQKTHSQLGTNKKEFTGHNFV